MCDGASEIAIATLVIGAASEGYNAYNQNAQAKKQQDFNRQLQQSGDEAARKAFSANANAVQNRQQQQTIAAGQQEQQNRARSIRAMASARAAAGSAGVSGLSIDSMLNDFSRQQNMFDQTVNLNLGFQKQQNAFDMQGLAAQEQSQMASYMRPDVIMPGYVGAGLRIGADALQADSTYYNSTNSAKNATGG